MTSLSIDENICSVHSLLDNDDGGDDGDDGGGGSHNCDDGYSK